MRRLRERMASFEGTALDRMTSEISRLRAMSSLVEIRFLFCVLKYGVAYNELDVARSICSSIWVVEANQPAIFVGAQIAEF
jgi:hypothetical protein